MDIALKQRLVGASVLIALAVIVLPMLLGGRPEGTVAESRKIEIPEQPTELKFETRRYPIGDSPPSPASDPEISTPMALPTPDRVEPPSQEQAMEDGSAANPVADVIESGTSPAEDYEAQQPIADTVELDSGKPVEVAPEPPRVEEQAKPAAVSSGRYVVQVASFGSIANANRLSGQLRDDDFPILVDAVKSDAGTLHRVRVGPYPTEAAANQAVRNLRSRFTDLKPRVMDLEPDKAAQVTQPADPLVRWVVQVGSFSSATNADTLVARLKLEALSAYKEAVTSSGSTIYRVRVGPFIERDEAIRVDQQINDRLSLDGVVMSAD
jgi:DedD protein